jgi:hypothetical protein
MAFNAEGGDTSESETSCTTTVSWLTCCFWHMLTHRCSFIANSSSHSYLIASSSPLFYNGTTKSPSQAPTASPITLDPTKARNVTIPCGMNQRGSSFSCIFWLLFVALFVLSHCVSILLHNNEHQTSGTNIFSYNKWSNGCEYLNCLMRCRWSMSFALQLHSGLWSFNHSYLVHTCICIVVHLLCIQTESYQKPFRLANQGTTTLFYFKLHCIHEISFQC